MPRQLDLPIYSAGFRKRFQLSRSIFQAIAAQLRQSDISCEILDGFCHRLDETEIVQASSYFASRVVAFAVFHNTLSDAIRCAENIKRRDPTVTIVIGSAFASPHWKAIVEHPAVDYVIVGDGETAFRDLVKSVLADSDASLVPGVASVRDGKPHLTPPIAISELDLLPFPSRDLAPIVAEDDHSLSMYTSRGCAFGKCSFCYLVPYQKVAQQPLWRARSPENVVDELELLANEQGVKRVTFVDEDYFGSNGEGVERALKIAQLIIDRGLEVKYYVNALVKSLLFISRQGHIELLARSGLDSVFAGFESVSRATLVSYQKPQRPEHYDEVIDSLLNFDIRINPGLITFSASATLDEVLGNIELAQRMRYYDLFLFTRRLVDLKKSAVDSWSESMSNVSAASEWLEAYDPAP